MYPIKDGLSTDVRSQSFDDEAFETGNKNQLLVHNVYKSYTHVLVWRIFDRSCYCCVGYSSLAVFFFIVIFLRI